jgi:hypothetical protein
MFMRCASLLFIAIVLPMTWTACGRESPVEPSATLSGTWRGTLTRGSTSGGVTLEISQSGAGVTGTWSTAGEGSFPSQSGSLGGTVVGSTASLSLTPAVQLVCSGDITLSGTLSVTATVDGNRLAGQYVVFLCDDVASGRIEVTRE